MASSNRNRKFTWTHETRLAVHQLDTEFAFDLKQKTKIFSLLFPREFIDDGKMSIRIKSQTAEWKKTPPKRSNTWTAVLRTSSTAEVERTDMQIRIRKAAAEAGISSDVSRGASGVHGHNDDGNDNLSMDSRRELTPLSRKRRYAYQTPTSMEDESESNDELESENISMRPKRRRAWNNNDQHQAQVQITRTISIGRSSRPRPGPKISASRAPKTSISVEQTQVLQRTQGTNLDLSPKKIASASQPLIPVPERLAHPPLSGLLYRYWVKNHNEPHNSEAGFTARKFTGKVTIAQDPPHCSTVCWTDVFYHIDRSGKTAGYLSPFISVSNALWWTLRLALKERRVNGATSARISVIDASALDQRGVYHVTPYHLELKKKYIFTEGSWFYNGFHEHICYKDIPGRAILKTFRVDDLIAMTERDVLISRALRLDVLSQRGFFKGVILPQLREANIELDPQLAEIIAKVAHLMGLNAFARREHLSHLITDLIQGWGFRLAHATEEQWIQLAARFARSIADLDGHILPSRDSQSLEWALLDGVRCGASRKFNTRHAPDRIRAMEKQARMIGISDATEMLSAPAPSRAVRVTIQSYMYRPAAGAARAAVEVSSDEGLLEVIQVASPSRRPTVRRDLRAIQETFVEDHTKQEESITYDSD